MVDNQAIPAPPVTTVMDMIQDIEAAIALVKKFRSDLKQFHPSVIKLIEELI